MDVLRDHQVLLRSRPFISLRLLIPDSGSVLTSHLDLLIQDMEKEINNALGHGPPDEILSSAFKLRITRGDIQTLKNYQWLNDEVSSSVPALTVILLGHLLPRIKVTST